MTQEEQNHYNLTVPLVCRLGYHSSWPCIIRLHYGKPFDITDNENLPAVKWQWPDNGMEIVTASVIGTWQSWQRCETRFSREEPPGHGNRRTCIIRSQRNTSVTTCDETTVQCDRLSRQTDRDSIYRNELDTWWGKVSPLVTPPHNLSGFI